MKTSNLKQRQLISGVVGTAILITGLALVPSSSHAGTQKTKAAELRESSYYYGAFNRRDPFRSLVEGKFVRDTMMDLISLNSVELVGIVRGDLDRFALLEDEKGFTYILRVGDKVRNGTIVSIGGETMTARMSTFGQTSKYTLHMVQRQKGDKR